MAPAQATANSVMLHSSVLLLGCSCTNNLLDVKHLLIIVVLVLLEKDFNIYNTDYACNVQGIMCKVDITLYKFFIL